MCKEISTITGPSADRSHSSHNPVHRNEARPVLTAVVVAVQDPVLEAAVVVQDPALVVGAVVPGLASAVVVVEDLVEAEMVVAEEAGAVEDVVNKLL